MKGVIFSCKNGGHLEFMTKEFIQFFFTLFYWIHHLLRLTCRHKNQENTKILSKDMALIELDYNLIATIFDLCKKGKK